MRFNFPEGRHAASRMKVRKRGGVVGKVVDSGAAYWMGAVLAAPEEPSLVTCSEFPTLAALTRSLKGNLPVISGQNWGRY
jgi:hypothetical protein